MSDVPFDLVPLARVWEYEHVDADAEHPGLDLIPLIEREFKDGKLPVYGRVPHTMDRVRLRPLDCEINWIGPPGTSDYHPCAEPITDLLKPATLLNAKGLYVDLAILEKDWQRLCDTAMISLGLHAEATCENELKPPSDSDDGLRHATDPRIHKAITAVYDEAETAGEKPPNIKEIADPVLKKLRADGYEASLTHVRLLADEERHARRRGRIGARWRQKTPKG
jgi:hypothetical protein